MSIGLGKACAWNMDAHRARSLVAFGYNGECHVYHIKRKLAKNQKMGQKSKGDVVNRKDKSQKGAEGQTGGIDNFVTQRQAIFKTDSKKFQKGVKFSPNGQRLACAGSDG